MNDAPQSWTRDGLVVTTDRSAIDRDQVLALLHTTFWAATISRSVLDRAMTDSLVFAMLRGSQVIGFARVITDRTTYGYVTDVVVTDALRNQGLGQWLMECLLAHPDLRGLRRITLLTRDARSLYERCGFGEGPDAGHVYLEIVTPKDQVRIR